METGIHVRVMRQGKADDIDLTEMTEEEIEEWIRTKQQSNPDYDIKCIVALAKKLKEL